MIFFSERNKLKGVGGGIPPHHKVSGRDLIGFILDQIRGIRDQIGGKVVFLEYEKSKPKLRDFYKSCAFEENAIRCREWRQVGSNVLFFERLISHQ